jgi:tetratricopeptide (TPR) repeat protein
VALRIIETVEGPEDVRAGLTRLALARALDLADELAEAEEHAERALAIYGRVLGPDHWETGEPYEVLGRLAGQRGRLSEAEEHLRRSLSVREPLGPTHPFRAFTLQELTLVLRQTGRVPEAERAEREVAAILAEVRRES